MFRNLTDKINSAIASSGLGGNGARREKIETLCGMGFTAQQAEAALDATGNEDVQRALDMLLTQQQHSQQHQQVSASSSNSGAVVDLTNEDEALQRAMEESLIAARTTPAPSKPKATKAAKQSAATSTRTAASVRAGQAALARFESAQPKPKPKKKTQKAAAKSGSTTSSAGTVSSTSSSSSSSSSVPAPLHSKSKEERVERCVGRITPHPAAVDTLHRALSELKRDPRNPKYRTIDTSTNAYKQNLGGVPGAEDLLLTVNFYKRRGTPVLSIEPHNVDVALLWMAVSTLEQAKSSDQYLAAKRRMEFHKAVKDIQRGVGAPQEEAVARAGYISKCPSEPPAGQGALLQVKIGQPGGGGETLSRRFDGDDTFRDVVHWMGGHGSQIPPKILSREWCLVDLNRYPVAPIGTSPSDLNKTLQSIGCWPSGKLELRESDDEWRERAERKVEIGAARGLGAH